jgi:hypothetical protein
MELIEQLRAEARKTRDENIRRVQKQYRETLRDISKLQQRLNDRWAGNLRTNVYSQLGLLKPVGEFANLTTVQAAEIVLGEGKPLSLKELSVELHSRGCRPHSALRSMTNALRAGLQYHWDRFRLNDEGKWELVTNG